MAATAKFSVGDLVRAKEYDYDRSVNSGATIRVNAVDTTGRYAYYTGTIEDDNHYGSRNGESVYFPGGKYELHEASAGSGTKTYAEMDKDELARHVVAVGKRVMESATRQYGYCSEGKRTLDRFFREAGLGDFVTVTKTVSIKVEVAATASEAQIREAALAAAETASIS